jgi:phosphotransferase system HPr (HPr) family protein
MISLRVNLQAAEGLHARPAAEFVRMVQESGLKITVRRLDGRSADGGSILSLLTLGIKRGEVAIIEAPDSAETLVNNLAALLG